MQDAFAWFLVVAAVAAIASRFVRRRRRGTCCGARTCPAANELVRRIEADAGRSS